MRLPRLITVTPGLLIRGALPESVGPVELAALGITRVYSLRVRGQLRLIDWPGYRHEPMADGRHVPAACDRVVRAVVADVRAGHQVLVMCHQGVNRAGLVVALALCQLTGCAGANAITRLRVVRPRALSNLAFEAYVRSQ